MGRLIGILTKRFDRDGYSPKKKRRLGGVLVFTVLLVFGGACAGLTILFCKLSLLLGTIFEAIVSYQCLAAKSLYRESSAVEKALLDDDLSKARHSLSMIVGRDVDRLDRSGVIRAAVETVAENTSDGVIAPLLYLFIGGPTLGMIYKAVNTMDSMIGYKNERFIDLGRCAAKVDDAFNFVPSRLSALFMILASFLGGKNYDGRNAYRIWRRDRRNHSSPNSAQCESAVAGALSVRLGGASFYFGKLVEKPFIGDDIRPVKPGDIGLTNRLMFISELLCYLLCTAAIFMTGKLILIFQ